jgi:hypothetical protein
MKKILTVALLGSLLLSSCATLVFPERRGQPKGKLDPNAMVMDAGMLLFWIIPGVVAYIVDFTTGAIYLPPGVEEGQGPIFGEDAPLSIN